MASTGRQVSAGHVRRLGTKLSKLSPTKYLQISTNIYKYLQYLQISTQVFVLLLSLLHTTLSDPSTFNLPHDAVDFRWVYGR